MTVIYLYFLQLQSAREEEHLKKDEENEVTEKKNSNLKRILDKKVSLELYCYITLIQSVNWWTDFI